MRAGRAHTVWSTRARSTRATKGISAALRRARARRNTRGHGNGMPCREWSTPIPMHHRALRASRTCPRSTPAGWFVRFQAVDNPDARETLECPSGGKESPATVLVARCAAVLRSLLRLSFRHVVRPSRRVAILLTSSSKSMRIWALSACISARTVENSDCISVRTAENHRACRREVAHICDVSASIAGRQFLESRDALFELFHPVFNSFRRHERHSSWCRPRDASGGFDSRRWRRACRSGRRYHRRVQRRQVARLLRAQPGGRLDLEVLVGGAQLDALQAIVGGVPRERQAVIGAGGLDRALQRVVIRPRQQAGRRRRYSPRCCRSPTSAGRRPP